jgi:lincosamide and streptogramin A transport system ATP-binding/permease protein
MCWLLTERILRFKGQFFFLEGNRQRQDDFELAENEKLIKTAEKLDASARKAAGWSMKTEAGKYAPGALDKGYIGHKSAKMMKRAKNIERRKLDAVAKTKELLHNIEKSEPLSITPLVHHSKTLVEIAGLSISYQGPRCLKN